MKPFYEDAHNTIYCLDFRKNELPNESVQCVVTSPPYWGLRKYSGEQELIWGDNDCEHSWNESLAPGRIQRDWSSGERTVSKGSPSAYYDNKFDKAPPGNSCSLCSAWKGPYGLEPTPKMYIEHTIHILREIRRVLRKDGVVFWNIGDSYGSGKGTCFNPGGGKGSFSGHGDRKDAGAYPLDRGNVSMLKASGLKPKDLCLIPFRLAIAAQEDGWWVRSVIIWSKPNPMPESVKDRPTESHEYILMLTKSARYYWDADAVREAQSPNTHSRGTELGGRASHPGPKSEIRGDSGIASWLQTEANQWTQRGRNIRSVWEFPTQPYPEAHFAVFPEKLPELCIKATTPEVGCCSKCGAPWARVLDKKPSEFNIRVRDAKADRATPEEGYKATQEEIDSYPGNHPDPGYRQTTGWRPTCKCNADKIPSLVLDPFAGAGTTLWVAKKLNREAVGYEISEEYCRLAVDRCRQQVLI